MKVTQIIAEETVNEAPVSGIRQGLRKLGAKTLAKLGAKDAAAGMAGKVDAGSRANELYTQFRKHLGNIGMSSKQVDAGELRGWMAKNKLPSTSIPQSGTLNDKQIQQLFVKAVQDSYRTAKPTQPATTQQPRSKGQTPSTKKPRIPANIMSQINKLSDQQKQQLVKML